MGCAPEKRNTYHFPAGMSGVSEFGFDIFRSAGPLGRHTHKGFELVLLVAGRVVWEVEGTRHELRGGELWKSLPREEHRGVGEVMHPCELFWIVVEPTTRGLGLKKPEVSALKKGFSSPSRIVRAPADLETTLRLAMRELACDNSIGARGMILYALSTCARAFAEGVRPRTRRIPEQVRRALSMIDAALARPPSVPQLAGAIGLSPSRLTELFHQHVGMTPADYGVSRRVELASVALTETDLSITDIALDLGFSSTQHFSDTFRKRMGVTPSAHRTAARAPKRDRTATRARRAKKKKAK